MTNHERKHLPADMAGLDGLIELLRADLPEVLCEKHWMVDFDAVEAQRVEAATQLQALAYRIEALEAENERLRGALKEVFEEWAGSEGFIPETAPEGYLLYLTKRIAHIARAALDVERLTKWKPIETAPDDDWFLAAIEVHHKNGGHWWEYHVVWLDDETGDIHTDCEQGWSILDYSHWLALPDAPYPLSAARAALDTKP